MQPCTASDTTAWYLISTKPRQEHIALTNLERQGYTRPVKVDDPLVDLLRSREHAQPTTPLFSAGDTVVITEGPFTGLEAAYQMADAEQRAMVLLHILSQHVQVKIDAASLRKTG
jgi:transcriptional antiterminator RfaH